jgi:hypothetical protein
LEQFVAAVDGFDTAAKWVAQKFGTMEELIKATPEEIAEVRVEQFMKEGGSRVVRLGEKKGVKLWHALRNR